MDMMELIFLGFFAFSLFMAVYVIIDGVSESWGKKNPLDKPLNKLGEKADKIEEKVKGKWERIDETPLGEGVKNTIGLGFDFIWYAGVIIAICIVFWVLSMILSGPLEM